MLETVKDGPKRYNFAAKIRESGLDLKARPVDTLQVNITKLCNQACVHCHVDSSPRRREMMSDDIIEEVLKVLRSHPDLGTLDITGGAPELHPRFKDLVIGARLMGRRVIVRHNLSVTLDPHPLDASSLAYLPEFFAEQRVEVVSSLPYYQQYFTDRQRGPGVFDKSIESLRLLNAVGFGMPDTGLMLNLVYNPVGAFLPAPQGTLETDYHRELELHFALKFNHLFTITNMPIHRFKAQLVKNHGYEDYMEKLHSAFNPSAAQGIMCRNIVSVSYDGKLFDCDFNQMLGIDMEGAPDIFSFDAKMLAKRTIAVADHCFGCTAGAGSSCGGATAS